MKKLIAVFFLTPYLLFGQLNWNGQWKSKLKDLEIYINIVQENNALTLTIPAQGIFDYKADYLEIEGDRIDFHFQLFSATYYGNFDGKQIIGTWKQQGREQDLVFQHSLEKIEFNRPQEPKEPFPYEVIEVQFENKTDNITLAGTITKPAGEGPFPAIVLVSGSGPQNRDSEILKHKPFKVLADFYTKRGFVVLRYDERGIGESGGKFRGATSVDLSRDVESAVEDLCQQTYVDKKKIGIIGHSEGGLIAPMVASRNDKVSFIVLVAGPGIPGKEILNIQLKNSFKELGLSKEGSEKLDAFVDEFLELLSSEEPNDQIIDQFQGASNLFYNSLQEEDQKKLGVSAQAFYFSTAPGMLDPWMRWFIKSKPEIYLSKVQVPVLAINGKKDVQVEAKTNLKAIKKAVRSGGNKEVKTKKFSNLNHLIQKSKTGSGSEYAIIEETFNEAAMEYIYKWMKKKI